MTTFIPETMQQAYELYQRDWTRDQSRQASWDQASTNVAGSGGWSNRVTSKQQNWNGSRNRISVNVRRR